MKKRNDEPLMCNIIMPSVMFYTIPTLVEFYILIRSRISVVFIFFISEMQAFV